MDGVRLRVAASADALPLSVLASQVFLDTYAAQGISPAIAREVTQSLAVGALSERLADSRVRFVVADAQGHLVGFVQSASGNTPELPDLPAVEIQRLYVLRTFAGRGIGARLLHQAVDAASAAGAAQAWLTAWAGNHRALAFYKRLGWRDAGAANYSFEDRTWENRLFVKSLIGGQPPWKP